MYIYIRVCVCVCVCVDKLPNIVKLINTTIHIIAQFR